MASQLIAKSEIFKNPITSVWVEYNGYLLGCTQGGFTVTPDIDVADIVCDQQGTKRKDAVYTGALWQGATNLVAVNEELLSLLVPGIENVIGGSNAATLFSPRLYESLRNIKGGVLRLIRNVNNAPSTDVNDIISWYEAVPVLTGELFKFTPGEQQMIPISFDLYSKSFADVAGSSITQTTINGTTYKTAFGYMGDPTAIGNNGVPAVTVPDREGPQFLSAEATDATTIQITFNESLDSVLLSSDSIYAKVTTGGVQSVVLNTATAINGGDDTLLDVTFPAASFSAGDVISVSLLAGVVEDADNNKSIAENDKAVTNSIV